MITIPKYIESLGGMNISNKSIGDGIRHQIESGNMKPIDLRVDTRQAFFLRREGKSWAYIAKEQHIRKDTVMHTTQAKYPFLAGPSGKPSLLKRLEKYTLDSHGYEGIEEYEDFMDDEY